MTRLSIPMLGVALSAALAAAAPAHAATEAVLYSFTGGADGGFPQAGLIWVGNLLYGTTETGGACGDGTVFSLTPSGVETVLHSFCAGSDGGPPQAGLVYARGTLYGTTLSGGSSDLGVVFAVTTATGTETVLHSFTGGSDGANPAGNLVYEKKTRTLYGTTEQGGTGTCQYQQGCGTVFAITTAGVETVLHSFTGGSDGDYPAAGLKAVGETFFGTTEAGGAANNGTVFAITPTGAENVVYAFQGGNDAAAPIAPLIDTGGALYGTTYLGGTAGAGTVFEVSSTGLERVVYSFQNNQVDGMFPTSPLIVGGGGQLYGTTAGGGTGQFYNCIGTEFEGCGTVFAVTRQGAERIIYDFQGQPDAGGPAAGLLKADATLYGTTEVGGAYGNGAVYTVLP